MLAFADRMQQTSTHGTMQIKMENDHTRALPVGLAATGVVKKADQLFDRRSARP
ncbi:hypothetical protein ACWEGE_05875 [Amycolatopsis sp. NPDC004747]